MSKRRWLLFSIFAIALFGILFLNNEEVKTDNQIKDQCDKKEFLENEQYAEIVSEELQDQQNQENGKDEQQHQQTQDNGVDELQKDQIQEYINNMTIEEKVAQLFIVLPESMLNTENSVTVAGAEMQKAIETIPIGGFIFLNRNLQSKEQVQSMLANMQKYSNERIGLPAFLCVDEEGGTVARISGNENFDVPRIGNMSEVGETKNVEYAYDIGVAMGQYLSELGFNVDFAPVVDVLTNPNNNVVRLRSFGTDAEDVSSMSDAISDGLRSESVYSTYKHFPGHGGTNADTHEGYASISKTLDELMECEMLPFIHGIKNGVSFIMVGHISTPNITRNDLPASLSSYMINQVLRTDMKYEGIVITDAMNMGAITLNYSSKEAAVKALQAGVDIVLMPQDFTEAYEGVLDAVEDGDLSLERINESVSRIIKVKLQILKEQRL